MWLSEFTQNGLVPHKDSFGWHEGLLSWYEIACWVAMVAWMGIFFIALALRKKIEPVVWGMIRNLAYLVLALILLSTVRWFFNAWVLHYPWYQVQTSIYLLDAHLGIAIATFGFWYLIRKENNIFTRMARHKRNSQRWEAMAESMRLTGIVEFDEGSNIWFVNPAMHRIFGYDWRDGSADRPPELLGEKVTILMPESRKQGHLDEINLFLETGRSEIMEALYPTEKIGIRKDGSEFPMEITMSAYKLSESYRFVAVIRDISYRKKLETALGGLNNLDT